MASATSVKSDPSKGQTATEPSSLPGLCLAAVTKHNKADALNQKVEGEWRHVAAKTFVERVRNIALGLAALGIRPGDRIALLSENRPEWSISDLAILSLGAINVPIYTTQAVDQIGFILGDSGTRAIFISNRKLYRHARAALADRKHVESMIFSSLKGLRISIEPSHSTQSREAVASKRNNDPKPLMLTSRQCDQMIWQQSFTPPEQLASQKV